MFTIIDIETTGSSLPDGKITEIAIFVHDGLSVVNEFQTLINPGCYIPPFITRMTGITNEMVAGAPKFFEVAKKIVEITEGKIFVAHNSQFDYSFIRQEFKTLGYDYKRDTLCTCKLSRKLLPGFPSYSLGKLAQSLNIPLNGRHRAGGDAAATVKLFEKILSLNKNTEVSNLIKPWNYYSNLPDNINPEIINKLPDETGVYYFVNSKNEIIYIGKSQHIKSRVLAHFKNKRSAKTMRLKDEVAYIRFELTGSELIALLLESDEIKKHQPVYNRSRKRKVFHYGIFDSLSAGGYICLDVRKINRGEKPIAAFVFEQDAMRSLDRRMKHFNLCSKFCGFETMNDGACFDYKIKQCNGACAGIESADAYNTRVKNAIATFLFEHPDFLLIGKGRKHEEKSVIKVENGDYKGYGFFEPEFIGSNPEMISDCVTAGEENPDTLYLIKAALKNRKYEKLIICK